MLISHARRHVDGTQFYKRAVETALPFRRRREVGFAAMLKQARARGKNLVQWQPGLLQRDGPEKSNIQVPAPPGNETIGAVVQGFHGIERAELTPCVGRELELSLDPPFHDRLMLSVVHDQRWTPGKTGCEPGLEPVPGHRRLRQSGVVLGIAGIREARGGKGALALEASGRRQRSVVRAVVEV